MVWRVIVFVHFLWWDLRIFVHLFVVFLAVLPIVLSKWTNDFRVLGWCVESLAKFRVFLGAFFVVWLVFHVFLGGGMTVWIFCCPTRLGQNSVQGVVEGPSIPGNPLCKMRNFFAISFPIQNGSRDRDTMMLRVPIAGQNQTNLAIGSRLNCLTADLPDFQKTWGTRPQHASNFKASCEHCRTTIGFSKWSHTISQYAMYQPPFTYLSPQMHHFSRTGRERKWKKTRAPIYNLHITLLPRVIEVKVTSHKFPWKRKVLISSEHSLVILTSWQTSSCFCRVSVPNRHESIHDQRKETP